MKDLYHNLRVSQPLTNAVATSTQTSSAIDRKGFDSLAVVFAVGNSADTLSGSVYWTLKLQHSDDDSVYTDVAVADLHNGSATVVIDAPSEDSLAVTFGYKGEKQYVKAVATATGTHTNGTSLSVIAICGNPSSMPVA